MQFSLGAHLSRKFDFRNFSLNLLAQKQDKPTDLALRCLFRIDMHIRDSLFIFSRYTKTTEYTLSVNSDG